MIPAAAKPDCTACANSLEEALEIIRAANRMAAGGGHPNAPRSV